VEHIGFGIRRIRVRVIPDDTDLYEFEKTVESIQGVAGVEVVSVMRVG